MTDAPHKMVDGEVVLLTAQEIAAREAEEIANAAAIEAERLANEWVSSAVGFFVLEEEEGLTEANLIAAINSSGMSATQKREARAMLRQVRWYRGSSAFAAIQAALGYSDAEADALWAIARAKQAEIGASG